jgi:SnoaL-like domain
MAIFSRWSMTYGLVAALLLVNLESRSCFVQALSGGRSACCSFVPAHLPSHQVRPSPSGRLYFASPPNHESETSKMESKEEYRNWATQFLSNFMSPPTQTSVMAEIDWNVAKVPITDLSLLAQVLDAELYASEWFVTGRVCPQYFADDFAFQDPDVAIRGIQTYARGVAQIFAKSRAEILHTTVTAPDTITCRWRLSGRVNIGPTGLTIKPYWIDTDFTVRQGLIVFQQDRFAIPQWDILLSALFPFLTEWGLTSPPAPPVPPRDPIPMVPTSVRRS